MDIKQSLSLGRVGRVAKKNFANAVESAAQDFALAAELVASVRGGGKVGAMLLAASKALEVTRAALTEVLEERFSDVMSAPELAKLKSAAEKASAAHEKVIASAFPPGAVVGRDDGRYVPDQAASMKAEAKETGQTYARLIDGKPLVIGPETDVKKALGAWGRVKASPDSPSWAIEDRHRAELQRKLTSDMKGALTDPADRALWDKMRARFPDVYVGQRESGELYVALPEAKERGVLESRTASGATLEDAFKRAKQMLTDPETVWVIDVHGPGRQELHFSPAFKDWVPAGATRDVALPRLSPSDQKIWDALSREFPGVGVKQRTDGSFYVDGLPERKIGGVLEGLTGEGADPVSAMRDAIAEMTKKHDRLVRFVGGERQELTYSEQAGGWRPYRDVLAEDARTAVTRSGGDARAALKALADVRFPDVKLALVRTVDATSHTDEAIAEAGAQVLTGMLRAHGDLPRLAVRFDEALDGLSVAQKRAALAAALALVPDSRALAAYEPATDAS